MKTITTSGQPLASLNNDLLITIFSSFTPSYRYRIFTLTGRVPIIGNLPSLALSHGPTVYPVDGALHAHTGGHPAAGPMFLQQIFTFHQFFTLLIAVGRYNVLHRRTLPDQKSPLGAEQKNVLPPGEIFQKISTTVNLLCRAALSLK
jgi:hypothetical protein